MVFPEILLASNSPRRRQMLAWIGLPFIVRPADIDEAVQEGESPADLVVRLSETKARTAARSAAQGQLVLAADTDVAVDGCILGKPASPAEAVGMLERLRGRVHQVYTALALLDPVTGNFQKDLCVSHVPMRAYSEEEISAYVASGDPLDKAGAYAIQHTGFHPVVDFEGCFASVMGLPLCHLERSLKKFGVTIKTDIRRACLENLGYNCPIYESIHCGVLNG